MPRGTVEFRIETCKGCELCIDACPQESLALSKEINTLGYHYAVLVKDNCTGCVNCALVCPDAVITVYRASKKSSAKSSAAREPVATISNVKSNIKVVLDEVPEGRIDI
ncbi:MAG TPA: 4Fe-4S dicluster domain-containing protein [Bacteroidota bacterium]|nr:4Fe-4S dicluster domain-containing protein [Bacteroidota bacterium]